MAEDQSANKDEQKSQLSPSGISQPEIKVPTVPVKADPQDAKQQPESGTNPTKPLFVQVVGGDDLEPFEEQTLAIARETLVISRRTYWIAIMAFGAAAIAAAFVGTQVKEMSYQTQIMGSQSESAAASAAMGELNTRNQLVIAQQQAAALNEQVKAMNRQLALSTAAQIPFVFLKEMPQQTEDIVNDSLVKWTEVWHNSGGSKPIGLTIWSDCTDFLSSKTMDFHRHIAPPVTVIIGPNTDRDIVGCESSYNFLKKLDDENLARAHIQDNTRDTMYVFGGADYRDFLDHPHTVEYCYQIYWDNRSNKFGFHLIECQAPNEGHNCTDEECKDWKPEGRATKAARKPN